MTMGSLLDRELREQGLPTQVTVVGSTHMDFIAYMESFPKPGETVTAQSYASSPGGKGANQAVTVAKLGARSHFVSRVGTDFVGDMLIQNLRKQHVLTEHVTKDPRDNSGVALIYVNASGENMIAVAPGVDHQIVPRDIEESHDLFGRSRVVLSQLEIPLETVEHAMRLGRKMGAVTILNPAPATPLPAEVMEYVDVLTPNRIELEVLSGTVIESDKDVVDAAHVLIEKGVKHVVVTLGERGSMIVAESEYLKVSGLKVDVVDTVGAGDAFSGALAVALSMSDNVLEAVNFANLVAAIKVTMRGAQTGLPTLSQVIEFSRTRHLPGIPRSFSHT
jgi:ribokinase